MTVRLGNLEINAFIEALMVYKALFKKELNAEYTNSSLLKHFEVTSEEDLLVVVSELIESKHIDLDQWLLSASKRNDYDKRCQMFFEKSKGFPVLNSLLLSFLSKGFDICELAAGEAIKVLPNVITLNSRTKRFQINKKVIAEYLGIEEKDVDVYKMVSSWKHDPILSKVYLFHNTEFILMGKAGQRLKTLCKQGYIAGGYKTFNTVTGRNTQQLNDGFILNAHPWFRSIIKPKPGKAFLKFDWKAQEPWVAAIMTGDQKLLKAYYSDDFYLQIGKDIGIVPQQGLLKDFKIERGQAKQLQLGISYGEGKASLSSKIENGVNLYDRHQSTYTTYWEWVKLNTDLSFDQGYYESIDHWYYFIFNDTPKHLLKNAPFQIEAAGMLRKAVMLLDSEIDLVATHHDALYVNCDIRDINKTSELVKSAMDLGAKEYFGVNICPKIDYEAFVDQHYLDDRGIAFIKNIEHILGKSYI